MPGRLNPGRKVECMKAYSITYSVRGKTATYFGTLIDAKDVKSAKRKLGHKHGYKDGRMIELKDVRIIGYY